MVTMEKPSTPFGDLRFVVSGTVRGGTHFIANVLNELGILTAHEGFHRTQPMFMIRKGKEFVQTYEGEVSGNNGYLLKEIRAHGLPVFHLWRNPVRHVNSVLRRWGGLDGGEWTAAQVAQEWMKTHQKILECGPQSRIAVEDPIYGLIQLYEEIRGIRPDRNALIAALNKFQTPEGMCANTAENAPSPKEITWKDLPSDVEDFARRIGGYMESDIVPEWCRQENANRVDCSFHYWQVAK